jgi:hypothetical protein
MRILIFTVLFLECVIGCATHRETLLSDHRYRVIFPPIKLATAEGERIQSVEVTVTCGSFDALSVIPDDWSVEVVSPVSERTTLRTSAGHGSSTLWSLRDLDGAIAVSVKDLSCFDITATVGTTAGEHRFTRSDLVLRPCRLTRSDYE